MFVLLLKSSFAIEIYTVRFNNQNQPV